MALRKHECIELLSQHAEKIGFPHMVRLFESASPLDKKECQRQYWNKVNVKTLRQFVESIQNAGKPDLMPSYAVNENDLPETIEEIEYIEEDEKEYEESSILFPEANEDDEKEFDWDDDSNDWNNSDEWEQEEDEIDLFDLDEQNEDDDLFEL